MAGHSQFKNIMHRKGAQDAKRAKMFTKLIREIMTAVKTGAPDPNFNPRLRGAISAARAANMTKDKIDNAIKVASSGNNTDNYDEIRYEGYAPGGVALIVEALTDNRNRTASEVRSAFTKHGGNLGETGSVSFMFEKIGMIEYSIEKATTEAMLDAAIEAGANDVLNDEFSHQIITDPDNLHGVRDALSAKFGDAEAARFSWHALNQTEITNLDQAKSLLKLIDALEDSDDVQHVSGNYIIENELIEKL